MRGEKREGTEKEGGGRNVGEREEGRKERREEGGEKKKVKEKGEDERHPVSFLPSSLLSCALSPVLQSSLDIWRANVSQSLRLKLNTITGCS